MFHPLFPLAKRPFILLAILLGGVATVFGLQARLMPAINTEVVKVLAVPGEAIFIRSAEGHRVLIDTGETAETASRLSDLLPFYDRSLDAVVLTHTDHDHAGGLPALFESIKVGQLMLPGNISPQKAELEILSAAKQRGVPVVYLHPQSDFRAGDLVFDTVAPIQSLFGQQTSQTNTASAVIRLTSPNQSILFTGDIEKSGERALLKTAARLSAGYLKVAHHGSKTSSSPDFLAAVRPKTALIAVSPDNPFHHPHKESLDRLMAAGAVVRQTAIEGDLQVSLAH